MSLVVHEIGGFQPEPAGPPGDRRLIERLPGGGFAYVLQDEGVRFEARDLRRERGGQLQAIVTVICRWGPDVKNPVVDAHYNLSSQTARNGISKYCLSRTKHKDKAFDWNDAIDSACIAISAADRASGVQAIVLDDAPEPNNLDFEVMGLYIPADAPSILIAHGDSMKSFSMLLILGTLAQRGYNVGLLDWEWHSSRHLGRKRRLFGSNRLSNLYHIDCRGRSLALQRDGIARLCDTHKIHFLGLDSIGMACDGPLKDDDTAIRFHQALATLPCPTLCAAHVPKSAISADPDEPITPFGSVFFSNQCRASWLVKKQTTNSPDVVAVNFYAGKQNDGRRRQDVAMQFDFSDERIHVQSIEALPRDAGKGGKLNDRIDDALRTGSKTYVQLAQQLGAKKDSVIKAVNRGITGKNPRWTRVPGTGTDNVFRIGLKTQGSESSEAEE